MPKPPTPQQRTYRGIPRREMRSLLNHSKMLLSWQTRFAGRPFNSYPNQLFTAAQQNQVGNFATLMQQLLDSKGPIPSR